MLAEPLKRALFRSGASRVGESSAGRSCRQRGTSKVSRCQTYAVKSCVKLVSTATSSQVGKLTSSSSLLHQRFRRRLLAARAITTARQLENCDTLTTGWPGGSPTTARHPVPLSPEQVQTFCSEGFISLQPSVPQATHDNIVSALNQLFEEQGGNQGNNVLPAVPSIMDIANAPEVVGGLQSLLGPGYALHPHRHAHLTTPGRRAQQLHRDSYFGFEQHRHHVPVWLMLLYFPQATSLAMGPTSVLPRSHIFAAEGNFGARMIQNGDLSVVLRDWNVSELIEEQHAGSVMLMHYDMWHRGTANTASLPGRRWMVKLQFYRVVAPGSALPPLAEAAAFTGSPNLITRWLVNWLAGTHMLTKDDDIGLRVSEAVKELTIAIQWSSSDHKRIPAAYELALRFGASGTAALLQLLLDRRSSARSLRAVRYGLTAAVAQEVCIPKRSLLVDELLLMARQWQQKSLRAACSIMCLTTLPWAALLAPQRLHAVEVLVGVLHAFTAAHAEDPDTRAMGAKLIGRHNVGACAAEALGFAGQLPDVQRLVVDAVSQTLEAGVAVERALPPSLPVGEVLMASAMAAVRLVSVSEEAGSLQRLLSACSQVVHASVRAEVLAFKTRWKGDKPGNDFGLRYTLAYCVEALVRSGDEATVASAFEMLRIPGQLTPLPPGVSNAAEHHRMALRNRWCHFSTSKAPF